MFVRNWSNYGKSMELEFGLACIQLNRASLVFLLFMHYHKVKQIKSSEPPTDPIFHVAMSGFCLFFFHVAVNV